jgi:hypothetical protein
MKGEHSVQKKAKSGAKMVKMARGGMAAQSNAGGAMRGLERAAAMSGRAMPATGRPMGMKKGGSVDGCAVKGKTKGKMVKMAKGGKC